MKALSLALLLMASMAFVLLGCSDNSNSLVTPAEKANPSVTLAKMGTDMHSATGSGHFETIPVLGETNDKCEFSAIQHADGTFSGELQYRGMTASSERFYIKAQVYDLKVTGNSAKLAVRFLRQSENMIIAPGTTVTDQHGWLVVIDKGKGSSAEEPDIVSLLLWGSATDLLPYTISEIDNMGVDAYLMWVENFLAPYGITLEQYLAPIDHGSATVR